MSFQGTLTQNRADRSTEGALPASMQQTVAIWLTQVRVWRWGRSFMRTLLAMLTSVGASDVALADPWRVKAVLDSHAPALCRRAECRSWCSTSRRWAASFLGRPPTDRISRLQCTDGSVSTTIMVPVDGKNLPSTLPGMRGRASCRPLTSNIPAASSSRRCIKTSGGPLRIHLTFDVGALDDMLERLTICGGRFCRRREELRRAAEDGWQTHRCGPCFDSSRQQPARREPRTISRG